MSMHAYWNSFTERPFRVSMPGSLGRIIIKPAVAPKLLLLFLFFYYFFTGGNWLSAVKEEGGKN